MNSLQMRRLNTILEVRQGELRLTIEHRHVQARPAEPDTRSVDPFAVASTPAALVFDGTNIWVANQKTNNVTKLRASDSANLGNFPAGIYPVDVAFDGANIWVTNRDGNTVTELSANSGATLGTYPVGSYPLI